MKRVGIVLLCALLLLFMFLVPQFIEKQVKQDIYLQWMSGKRGWEGVLRLWHVSSFLTGTGSDGSAWINARAREYEKRNFGLFIEVESMSIAEATSRLEKGETPDIWSFPSGFSPGSLEPFRATADIPAMLPSLLRSGQKGGEQLGVPILMSGYMLLGNIDLLESRDISLPDTSEYSNEKWDKEKLTAAVKSATFVKKIGKQSTPYFGFTYATGQRMGLAGIIDRLPAIAQNEYAVGEEKFISAQAALCAGTLGTMGTLDRMEAAGKGFSYFSEPAGNFTDCVQYAGIQAGLDDDRAENATDFVLWLLRDKGQRQLSKHGALCVIESAAQANAAAPDEYSASVKKLAQILLDPIVPNAFEWSEKRGQLEELAAPALGGDAAAIAKFNSIMLE